MFKYIVDIRSHLYITYVRAWGWVGGPGNGKLGNKERFDKVQIGIRNHLLHKDKELLALRNNFRATRKFLIATFDCTTNRRLFKELKGCVN